MICHLYLVIERSKPSWKGPRIARVAKKRPTLTRPTEQALVHLAVDLPKDLLEPRVVRVDVKPEHVSAPTVTATSQPGQ